MRRKRRELDQRLYQRTLARRQRNTISHADTTFRKCIDTVQCVQCIYSNHFVRDMVLAVSFMYILN